MTSDDILLFLVKNSKPQNFIPVDVKPSNKKKQNLLDLFLRLSGTTTYKCSSKSLEDFLGEKIDFEKHLRPLYENKILYFSGVSEKGSYYDTPEYREAFKYSTGQTKNYDTGESFISFHYAENDFLKEYYEIVENAIELNIIK